MAELSMAEWKKLDLYVENRKAQGLYDMYDWYFVHLVSLLGVEPAGRYLGIILEKT